MADTEKGYFARGNKVVQVDPSNTGESRQETIDEFRRKVTDLINSDYTMLNASEMGYNDPESSIAFQSTSMNGGGIGSTFNMFDSKNVKPVKIEGIGSKELGYIEWGPSNRLPNQIFSNAGSLPYTAAAMRYLSDLTVGYGPKFMYHFTSIEGKTEDIPYEDAGKRILLEIASLRKIVKEGSENEESNEIGSPEFFLAEYEKDYKTWKSTNGEYQRFIEYNDLNLHYLSCAIDDMHMDIYFPTIGLSIGKSKEDWNPKIMKVGLLPAACCRLEEKDKNMRINYVYYSEMWRSESSNATAVKPDDCVAYPALMQEDFLARLRRMVKNNVKTSIGHRPTWFCCPCIYPSMHKPYYPQPAWWSIFPSQTYDYATTLITDKAISRRNSTMWGKLVFINLEYLRQLYDDMEADTIEKKGEVKALVLKRIDEFLLARDNNGKPLAADMYPSPDGKSMLKSIEIVDVPKFTQSREMKDELEEVSSIIFFAASIHPSLIGSIPGAKASSGGTFQRELHLLKQTQMGPRQRIYLRFLQNISTFNGWDAKGVWQIAMPVLTTLDRNKTGIEEM